MSAHVFILNKNLYSTLSTVMFNRRKPCFKQAIHALFDAQLFVAALFSLLNLYIFWIRYKIDVISSYGHRSVVRMMQMFDLEKCFITFCMPLLNFSKMLLQVFKQKMTLCKNGFLIY